MNLYRTCTAFLAAAAAFVAPPALAQTSSYRVDANSTGYVELTICNPEVYISVRGDGDTDLDFTVTNSGGDVIHTDVDYTDITFFTLYRRAGSGCEDFQLEVRNLGNVWNQYEVVMETIRADRAATGSKDGYNRTVTLVNNAKETIYYIYWSNTASGDWGADRLGSDVLMAGNEWQVTVDDGTGACRFDFKARTSGGREIERRNIDVCAVSYVTFD